MIHLTRLNQNQVVLNSDLIEHVERTPDTVISLTTGTKLLVLETPDEVVDRVIEFRRTILQGLATPETAMASVSCPTGHYLPTDGEEVAGGKHHG
jgi:flagellar protein FlbD